MMRWTEPKDEKKPRRSIFFRNCCMDILKAKRTLQKKNRPKGSSYEEWLEKVYGEEENASMEM